MDEYAERAGHAAPQFLTSAELAELLRVQPQTIRRWRREGPGPAYIKRAINRILYPTWAIDEWMRTRTRYGEQ
jgi:hypothetical protein